MQEASTLGFPPLAKQLSRLTLEPVLLIVVDLGSCGIPERASRGAEHLRQERLRQETQTQKNKKISLCWTSLSTTFLLHVHTFLMLSRLILESVLLICVDLGWLRDSNFVPLGSLFMPWEGPRDHPGAP